MTELVGILNITPDSFSDGGKWLAADKAIVHAKQLIADGAAIIDIGAESTRPGAAHVSEQEEWQRLEPVLRGLAPLGLQLSLDTRHVNIVKMALRVIPNLIINDVTGFADPEMQQLVADKHLRCIVSHLAISLRGDIQAAHTTRLIDDEQQVIDELKQRRKELIAKGVKARDIILDPGIGFGKTPELNKRLLGFARHFPDDKVMIGYSRKRFLGDARMELPANLEAGKMAIAAGAAYLRVHDVAGHAPLL